MESRFSSPPPSLEEILGEDQREEPEPPEELGYRKPPAILHPYLPSSEVHILSGSSGAGKTTWVAWLIARILANEPVFGHSPWCPPFIAYISGDRVLNDAQDKFTAAGWTTPACYGLVDDGTEGLAKLMMNPRNDAQDGWNAFPLFSYVTRYLREHFLAGARQLPPGTLLIIDGMATILGIEPVGKYRADVAIPMVKLNRLCHHEDLTVLLVHHGAKQIADPLQRYARAQDRILGSMALQGFTSTQIQLTEPELTQDPKRKVHELTVVSHRAAGIRANFRRNDDGSFKYVELEPTDGLDQDDDLTKTERKTLMVLESRKSQFPDGMRDVEIAQYMGVGRVTALRALHTLLEKELVVANPDPTSRGARALLWRLVSPMGDAHAS